MPILPSGRHCCLHDAPLQELLDSLDRSGLRIPDLLCIAQESDLRRYLRLMWLLPIGADTRPQATFHALSGPVPDGLTMVDSGNTLDRLPDDLDAADRAAIETFWQSQRCQEFLRQHMTRVREAQHKITLTGAPEDRMLHQWFQDHMSHPSLKAARDELRAAMIEAGLVPKKGDPPPPRMSPPVAGWRHRMNRKRPCHHRLLRPVTRHVTHAVTLRDATRDSSYAVTPVTPVNPHRQPLLLCGLLSFIGAVMALACTAWAPGIVLSSGSVAFFTARSKASRKYDQMQLGDMTAFPRKKHGALRHTC